MSAPPIARTNYFDGEALLTADFVCEQTYHMEMLAALNRGLHVSGIAYGLDVYWQDNAQSRQVSVSAGMAIDRLGREIILTNPQLVVLGDIERGYDEAFADLTDQTKVPGYKRIVQQPRIDYTRSLPDPGLDILLAVVRVSSDGAINTLTYKAGAYERRYVGGRFGRLELLTQRSGIDDARSRAAPTEVTLSAHLEEGGAYLAFEARRSRFDGTLSVGGTFGIGIEHPHADLQVSSAAKPGPGECTSDGTTLTLTRPISPPLRPGDVVVPQVPVGTAPPSPAWGVIAACVDAAHYTLEAAFASDLGLGHAYTYLRGTVAQVAAPVGDPTASPQHLLRIDRDGTVGLGMPATPRSGGGAGAAALSITSDRRVGVGLVGAPRSTARLEVNGAIDASGLSVAGDVLARGTVKAGSFEGNGAKLRNLPILSLWTKVDPTSDVTPIYYNGGSVCVQTARPFGALTVGTGPAFVGSGLVTLSDDDILKGNQTRFREQVGPGDKILVGALRQLAETVAEVVSDTELILRAQFPVLLSQTSYKVKDKDGTGTISSDGTRILGVATTFTKDAAPGDMLQITSFDPHGDEAAAGRMVLEVVGDDELRLVSRGAAPASDTESPGFVANLSAYMVRPALLGHFQDTNPLAAAAGASRAAPGGEPVRNTPALLVVSNAMTSADVPNTVAINHELADVRPDYALMVNGPVSLSGGGGGHFDELSARDLSVTGKATMAALTAAGATIHDDGSVELFGAITGGELGLNSETAQPSVTFEAPTDGFVIAQLFVKRGSVVGLVDCRTPDRYMTAAAASLNVMVEKTIRSYPNFSTITMPVKKGEQVSIRLGAMSEPGSVFGRYQWIPLGPSCPAIRPIVPTTAEPPVPMPDLSSILATPAAESPQSPPTPAG